MSKDIHCRQCGAKCEHCRKRPAVALYQFSDHVVALCRECSTIYPEPVSEEKGARA